MTKEFKENHNSSKEQNGLNSDAQKELKRLQEEKEGLIFTIKEQKHLIKELNNQINKDEEKNSKDVEHEILERETDILNDLCNQKETQIHALEEKLEKLINILKLDTQEQLNKDSNSKLEREKLLTSKKLIIHLLDENEHYQQRLDVLLDYSKSFLEWMKKTLDLENSSSFQSASTRRNEQDERYDLKVEQIHGKIKEFQEKIVIAQSILEDSDLKHKEENEANKSLININEDYNVLKYQLNNAYETIANLSRTNEKLEQENAQLKNNVDKNAKTIKKIKSKLQKYDLEQTYQFDNRSDYSKRDYQEFITQIANNAPNPLNFEFFERFFHLNFNLLADYNKDIILKVLEDILHQTKNREVIRLILTFLRTIKNTSEAIQIKHFATHRDWIVRLSLAQSLKDYYENGLIKQDDLQEILTKLTNDKDPDVRDSAINVIKRLKSV